MDCIALFIVVILLIFDFLWDRDLAKRYEEERRKEREEIEEDLKIYEEYKRREEEKRHRRESLELEIKNHQINLISNKDIR